MKVMNPEPHSPDEGLPVYRITTTPGDRVATAATIPDALAALASQPRSTASAKVDLEIRELILN